jgi:hypothetical protein
MFEGFGSFISVPITNAGRNARILLSFDASLLKAVLFSGKKAPDCASW